MNLKLVIEGGGSNNLTTMLVDSIAIYGGLSEGDLASRLVCFVADGVIVFQGLKTRVTMQFTNKHAPFVTGLHYIAHKCNLVAQTLSKLSIVAKVEMLMWSMHLISQSWKKFWKQRVQKSFIK